MWILFLKHLNGKYTPKWKKSFWLSLGCFNFVRGEMAERSIAAVLKTVDCYRSGGSNPSLSAERDKPLFKAVCPFSLKFKAPCRSAISENFIFHFRSKCTTLTVINNSGRKEQFLQSFFRLNTAWCPCSIEF